jgi:hypothetical protein
MSFAINAGLSINAAEHVGFLFKTSPGNALTVNQSVDGIDGFISPITCTASCWPF